MIYHLKENQALGGFGGLCGLDAAATIGMSTYKSTSES